MAFTSGNIFVAEPYIAGLDLSLFQLQQKAIYEFDPNGVYIRKWFLEPVPGLGSNGFGGGSKHIVMNNGIIYSLWTGPHNRIWELKSDGSVRVLFDFFVSSPDSPGTAFFAPQQITFDSDGNIYVLDSRIAPFPDQRGAIYKIDKNTGLLLRRWTINSAPNSPYDSAWLMDDDKTFLVGNSFADGWEGLIYFDLSEGDNLNWHQYAKIRSSHDAPNFGYYFDMEDIAVIDHHAYATIAPDNSGHTYDSVPITRVGTTEVTNVPMYFSNNRDGGVFEDEGYAIDCDPDGTSIWVASQSSDFNSLYRFNKDTGALLKKLSLRFDRGVGPSPVLLTAIYFTIAGGSGHHGCGCCVQPEIPGLAYYDKNAVLQWIKNSF